MIESQEPYTREFQLSTRTARIVYMNHVATMPLALHVLDAIPYLPEEYGNRYNISMLVQDVRRTTRETRKH